MLDGSRGPEGVQASLDHLGRDLDLFGFLRAVVHPVSIATNLRQMKMSSPPAPRRFPPPWRIEEHDESFIVTDATGQPALLPLPRG
jgi:hypothetical protein